MQQKNAQFYGAVLQTIGSSLGQVLANGSAVQGVLYSSLLGQIGQQLGAAVAGGTQALEKLVTTDAQHTLDTFASGVGDALASNTAGTISSLLFMQLGQDLGLPSFASQALGTVGSSVVSKVVSNVVNYGVSGVWAGFTPTTLESPNYPGGSFQPVVDIDSVIGNAIGSFLGAKLGALIYAPQTQAGEALASIGSAVGAFVTGSTTIGADAVGLLIDPLIDAAANIAGEEAGWLLGDILFPGVGALVGFVLGALIGDLFGHKKPRIPTASAQTVLQIPSASYQVTSVTSANGGDANFVSQMAAAARDTLNGIIGEITSNNPDARVANLSSPTQTYGLTGSQIYVNLGGTQHNVTTADQAVNQGVLWALPQTQVIGGDIFLKRAIANGSTSDLTILMGDLKIASDYEFYAKNRSLINAEISQAYSTLSSAEMTYYANNKALVDQIDMSGVSSLTSSQIATYNANQAAINDILQALQAQSVANPWIVTLQSANELNLAAWNASDFYGGLQGFLSSFGLGAMASGPHYENITIGWDGTNFSAILPSALGGGVFSIMPSASPDGSSLQINNFLSTFGYDGYGANAKFWTDVWSTSPWAANISSSSTNDILVGGSGGNTITAGSGADWIQGGSGADVIYGGSGYDTIIAGSGTTTINGGSGGGYFAAGSGYDTITTSAATTTVVGGTGTATETFVYAGSGNTTYIVSPYSVWAQIAGWSGGTATISFERYTQGVTANLAYHPSFLTSAWSNSAASYLYQADASSPLGYDFNIDVEDTYVNLVGSQYNDVLETSQQGGVLEGLAGADQLIGGGGITTASYQHSAAGVFVDLSANPNNLALDPAFLNYGQTWQNGYLSAPLANSYSVRNYSGAPVLTHTTSGTASAGVQMNTGDFDPTNVAAMTRVVVGQRYLVGEYEATSGASSVLVGVEWFTASGAWVTAQAVSGSIGGSFSNGLASAYAIGGVFTAPAGAVYGEVVNAVFANGSGPLSVSIADPTFELASPGQTFSAASLQTGSAYGGDATGDTFSNVQNLLGSSYNDELKGIYGSVLNGGPGNDTLDFSGGANSFIGGGGFDTVDYSQAPNAISVNFATGSGYVAGYANDGYSGVSEVIAPSYGSTVYGASGGSILVATGGHNYFIGQGSDTFELDGKSGSIEVSDTNSGSNVVKFGAGVSFDDLWIGTVGGASGYLQFGIRGQSGYVQVDGNFGAYPISGNDIAKTLDMAGAGQVDIGQITMGVGGSDSADTLNGVSNCYNLIFAYGGNDTIYAQANQVSNYGAVIDGGLGNDTIYASNGDDQYLFERGDGQDTIYDTGGQSTVVFGPTVAANDVIYQITAAGDLYIGLRDLNNSNLTASQVADNMRFVGGGILYSNANTGSTTLNTVDYVIAGGTTVNLLNLNLAYVVKNTGIAGGGGGGGGGSGHPTQPIVFDLYGDGLQLTPVASSDIVATTASGIVTRMGWVGPNDGVLAVDRSGNGQINTTDDISFVQDKAGATTDLQGLAGWDSNGDGVLNAKDANWNKLLIWVDRNQDGVAETGEAYTLAKLGITSINLVGTPTGFNGQDTIDSYITNTTTFTRADGTTGTAYDVALAQRFLSASGLENAPDVQWDQVTGSQKIGHILNDPMTQMQASLSLTASGSATAANSARAALAAVGQALGGAPITETALSKLAQIDYTPGQTISASAATRWSDFLDPTKNAALKAAMTAGMSGSDLLDLIKTTTAYPVGTDQLTGRGVNQALTRAAEPIVVDFSGSGLSLIDVASSSVKADIQHTGVPEQIGWVGPKVGILAYDLNGDGKVDPTSEISFAAAKPGAKTSIQGLAAYDTNGDGVINGQDSAYSKFLIWRDANGNGISDPGETQTLKQAGIASISLKASHTAPSNGVVTSSQVLGQITVTMADGTTRIAYDTALGVADPSAAKTTPTPPPPTVTAAASILTAAAPLASSASASAASAPAAASTSSTLGSSSPGVTASRIGEDGPTGTPTQAVADGATSTAAANWWATEAVSGSILDNTSPMTLGSTSTISPSGQGVGLIAASQDAATAQSQLLLRQSLAAFQGGAGSAAAIWPQQSDVAASAGALAAAAKSILPNAPAPLLAA